MSCHLPPHWVLCFSPFDVSFAAMSGPPPLSALCVVHCVIAPRCPLLPCLIALCCCLLLPLVVSSTATLPCKVFLAPHLLSCHLPPDHLALPATHFSHVPLLSLLLHCLPPTCLTSSTVPSCRVIHCLLTPHVLYLYLIVAFPFWLSPPPHHHPS